MVHNFVASDPQCNSTVDDEGIILSCQLQLIGNWRPQMQWRQRDGSQDNILLEAVETISIESSSMASFLKLPLNTSCKNVEFICTICFTESGKPHYKPEDKHRRATNVPEYNFTWIWPPPS